jgi:hypothetical protein
LQKTKKIKIALEIICRQQKQLALEKNFKEKIKTTCSRNNLQKTKKKLALEICRKQKTLLWSFFAEKKQS